MKKKEVVRAYKFSDGHLVMTTREKIAYLRRDATELSAFGINEAGVSGLELLVNAFGNTITDTEALADQTGATALKDAKKEVLLSAIRAVMLRAGSKFDTGSAKYSKFGTAALSAQSDADLVITGMRVVRVGAEYLSQLAEAGLTQTHLDVVKRECEEFSKLIVDAKLEEGNRDVSQEGRVEAGNAIYSTLVNMTDTGKGVWISTNAAKYNDYLINETESGAPPPSPSA